MSKVKPGKIRARILTFWSLLVLNSMLWSQIDSQSLAKLDANLAQFMDTKQIPGLSYAILHKNEVIKQNALGYANLEHLSKVKNETIFELASITKQFISVAILQLVENRIVELDTTIDHYLDSLPRQWRPLTLRQLLSHTAGLAPMHMEWRSLKSGGWPKYVSRKMLWNSAVLDSVYAEPSEQFRYHNTGYFLAILIVEKLTKQDHRDYFQKNIFDALGMQNTFFEDQTKIVPNLASGYTLKDEQLCKIWRVGQEEIGGGQGLYSNLSDMIKWIQAINSNALISANSTKEMFEKIHLRDSTIFHYGLGWWLPQRNGIFYHYHNGITGPEVLKIPEYNLDIIVLSNFGQGEFDDVEYWGMANMIAELLIPEFKYQPMSQPISSKFRAYFSGHYEYSDGSLLIIFEENDQYFLLDNYGKDELVYIGNHTFSLKDSPILFEYLDRDNIVIKEEVWENDYAKRISK